MQNILKYIVKYNSSVAAKSLKNDRSFWMGIISVTENIGAYIEFENKQIIDFNLSNERWSDFYSSELLFCLHYPDVQLQNNVFFIKTLSGFLGC